MAKPIDMHITDPHDRVNPRVNGQFPMDAFQMRMNGMWGHAQKNRHAAFVVAIEDALKHFGILSNVPQPSCNMDLKLVQIASRRTAVRQLSVPANPPAA